MRIISLFRAARLITFIILGSLLVLNSSCEKDNDRHDFFGTGSYMGEYWPTDSWRSCDPEELGVDPDKLFKVYTYCANQNINTDGLIIIKNGYIIGEAYFGDFSESTRHTSYSVAKSFTSATLGIAIDQGYIDSVGEFAYIYTPYWQNDGIDARKRNITIEHLLTMTGGLEWNEDDYSSSENDIFIMSNNATDFVRYVAEKPIKNSPGIEWYYSSGESMLLSGIIENAVDETTFSFAYSNLLQPIGITDIHWDYDPSGQTIGGWGVLTTVRNYARFAYLFLKKGMWDGQQIISEEWVDKSTSQVFEAADHYGYQWWLTAGLTNYDPPITPKTYMAVGIYTQRVIVVPEEDIVIVRVGNDFAPDASDWRTSEFLKLIMAAVN